MHNKDHTPNIDDDDSFRASQLKQLRDELGDDLEKHFGANSFGRHEVTHASLMVADLWFRFIVEHSATILDPKLFGLAVDIRNAIYKFYRKAVTD